MKIKVVLLIGCLFGLQGCLYQTVDWRDVEAGIHFCKDKGGVDYYQESAAGTSTVHCIEGSWVYTDIYYMENYKEFIK